MTRDELIWAFNYVVSRESTTVRDAEMWWRIEKAFPHVNAIAVFFDGEPNRTAEQKADEVIRLQQERWGDPLPFRDKHQELIDGIEFLQMEMRNYGILNYAVLIPLCLDNRYARLPELIAQTREDTTPEEVALEVYRREIEGMDSGQPPGPILLPADAEF